MRWNHLFAALRMDPLLDLGCCTSTSGNKRNQPSNQSRCFAWRFALLPLVIHGFGNAAHTWTERRWPSATSAMAAINPVRLMGSVEGSILPPHPGPQIR